MAAGTAVHSEMQLVEIEALVSHLPAHVYNLAHSEQRGRESSTGASTPCGQSSDLDLYAQAGMQEKRKAQSKSVRLILNKGEDWPNWTKLDHVRNCQFPASAWNEWRGRRDSNPRPLP